MDRLWVKLSIAFSAILLTGMIIIFAVTMGGSSIREGLEIGIKYGLEKDGGLIEELTNYYREQGTWDGTDTLLTQANRQYALIGIPLEVKLLTTNQQIDHAIPLQIGDQVQGYLKINLKEPEGSPPNDNFQTILFQQLQKAIIIVVSFSAIVGIISAILVSRSLTAPLSELAFVARAIRDRKTHLHVDITGSSEISDLATAFNEMIDALEHAEQLRRNLVADVAHELRTPLTVLQGNLYAILDDVYPADKSQIARLYDQTRILSRLVSDLHELSQAEARQLPPTLSNVDLKLLIEDIVTTFEPVAATKDITLSLQLPETLPTVVIVAVRIEQVLHNLLGNALRHTPEGGKITVKAQATESDLKIMVQDTGKGIPPDKIEHIFERFYRVDSNRSRAEGGSGLGLAIVRAIMQAHGGSVVAYSSGIAGEGTRFTISIPLSESKDI